MNRRTTSYLAVAATISGMAFVAPASAAIATNLQGYFKLDETSSDAGTPVVNSGSVAENGQIVSGIAAGAAGVVGTSYALTDGRPPASNDASVLAKADLTPGTSTLMDNLAILRTSANAATADVAGVSVATIGGWIRPVSNKSPTTGAASRSTIVATNADFQFTLIPGAGGSATSSDLFFNFRNASSVNVAVNSASASTHVPTGADAPWTHVVVARDGAQFAFYIDGVLVASPTATATTGSAADPFYQRAHNNLPGTGGTSDKYTLTLGTQQGSADRDFNGGIDDLGIWVDRQVNATEIAAIAGLGRFSAAGLDNAGIDAVLAVHAGAAGSASVGGDQWDYTTTFAAPADGAVTLVAGRHYLGADGNEYIILGGAVDNFTGVVHLVPEPASLAALAGIALVGLRRRRR